MSLINISNLTFGYDGSFDNLFEQVSFQIDTDWKLGLIGRNGKGKTTFFKLLMGKYEYEGSIASSVSFEYFPFEISDKNENTLDILNQINPHYELWALLKELSILNVDENTLYRPFCTLSNGEQTKILLALLFLKDNSFLLIDEPTNHLDAEGRKLVSSYLKSKKGFILVSHDRYFIDNCVDHILSINRANIEVQRGNFSSWWENKQLQDSFELAENEKLKKDIKRLSAAAKRTSDWSDKLEKTKHGGKHDCGLRPDRGFIGRKAANMMKRSKSLEERQQSALEGKSKLLKNIETIEALKLSPLPYHSKRLASLEDISIFYGENKICDKMSFTIEQGDRIALHGRNGCGKSSILKLLYGEDIKHTGTLKIGSNMIISYVSQDTSSMEGSLTEFAEKHHIDESLFKAILRKLDFSRVQFEKNMSDFSGGQKKKVLIAKSLCESAHLYIWDEPMNFIDVFSRIQIEALLKAYEPTILFVEHDKHFSDEIATKTVRF